VAGPPTYWKYAPCSEIVRCGNATPPPIPSGCGTTRDEVEDAGSGSCSSAFSVWKLEMVNCAIVECCWQFACC
jgi:hypothetical protein